MIFDTDVLIWMFRGNKKAANYIDKHEDLAISSYTYMELVQGATSKKEIKTIKNYLSDMNFSVLPITERIGHRATIYLEEYSLKGGLKAGDAIIAATASENNHPLSSGNQKHFQLIKDIDFYPFKI